MRRPGGTQTPGVGGRAAGRLRQYIEQRSGVTETRANKRAKRVAKTRKPKPPKTK